MTPTTTSTKTAPPIPPAIGPTFEELLEWPFRFNSEVESPEICPLEEIGIADPVVTEEVEGELVTSGGVDLIDVVK